MTYLSEIVCLDTLFQLKVPDLLQKPLAIGDARISSRVDLPDYPQPTPLKISTMTTTCYFSTLVHMQPVFYLLPLLDQEKLQKTTTETEYLRRPNALLAYVSSSLVRKHKTLYCPLKKFTKHFQRYCEDHRLSFNTNIIPDILDLGVIEGASLKRNVLNIYPIAETKAKLTKTIDSASVVSDDFVYGLDISPVFPCILDIKYKNVSRGIVSKKKKKEKTAFFNQCTMRIALKSMNTIVNLKIFKNGKLHMTGCKKAGDAEKAIQFLLHNLEMLTHNMFWKNYVMADLRLAQTLPTPGKNLSNRLWRKVLLHCDPWDLDRWRALFPDILKDPLFWLQKSRNDYRYVFAEITPGRWKTIEKYNERNGQYKKIFKSSVFDNPEKFYFSHHDEKERMPFIPLNPGANVQLIDVNVEMINSDFETGFHIDQVKLTEILRRPPHNLFVKFDPLNYPGVNIKYLCNATGEAKEISILVFRTGPVIITGGTCDAHLNDSYNFINGVFRKHYSELRVTSSDE